MTRHVSITERGVSTKHYPWQDRPVVRLSWALPGDTMIEVPSLPDDAALRVSLADLRAYALHRERTVKA